MARIVRTFEKYSEERRRLYVDYDPWLEESEELTDFQTTVSPYTVDNPLWLDTSYSDSEHRKLVFYASGGVPGEDYLVQLQTTTDEGQVKRVDIRIRILTELFA